MPRLPVAGENAAIAAILVPGTTYYFSVNTGDPGTTGANEMTGVTRQAVVFTAASAGAESNTAALAVPNPGTAAASYCSIWTAATGGTFVIGAPLASPVQAANITVGANQASFSVN